MDYGEFTMRYAESRLVRMQTVLDASWQFCGSDFQMASNFYDAAVTYLENAGYPQLFRLSYIRAGGLK